MANKKYNPKKYLHLRLEALCAELLSNGFSFENFIISRAGAFKRRFRKDIDSINILENDKETEDLEIAVNRDGIYDLLPEGLFHQPNASNKNNTVADMISDFRRLREEEKYARKFFKPLEQEISRYSILVEQHERIITSDILQGNLSGRFNKLWDLPEDLPAVPASILARILPWAYLVKADLKLTAKALEMILNKPVKFSEKLIKEQQIEDGISNSADASLGEDFVAGNSFPEFSVCWIFTINNILANEMELFLKEQPFEKLLSLFVEIFVPVEMDVVFEYEINKESLASAEKIVGYGFTL